MISERKLKCGVIKKGGGARRIIDDPGWRVIDSRICRDADKCAWLATDRRVSQCIDDCGGEILMMLDVET
jgi:hypothetical protein